MLKNTEIHAALVWVRDNIDKPNGLLYTNEGICAAYIRACEHLGCIGFDLKDYFKHWPKFSGVLGFPVPGTLGFGPLGSYYRERGANECLWTDDDYGKLRRELLDWLIDVTAGYTHEVVENTGEHYFDIGTKVTSAPEHRCGEERSQGIMTYVDSNRMVQGLSIGEVRPLFENGVDNPVVLR